MIETTIRDFLVENLDDLTSGNTFAGTVPGNAPATYCVVKKQSNPMSDSHNTIATKLSTPVGINQKSAAICVEVKSEDYQEAATLIDEIFITLGGEDGGCVNFTGGQAYIIPVESPYQNENTMNYDFIVRTNK